MKTVIGISWGDVADAGKKAFPYIHTAGKSLASAFGAGAAADALENVYVSQGWLPPQKPSVPSSGGKSWEADRATEKLQKAVASMKPKPKPRRHPMLQWAADHPWHVAGGAALTVGVIALLAAKR